MKPSNSKVPAKPGAALKGVKKAKPGPSASSKTTKSATPKAAKKPVTAKKTTGNDATLFKRQITRLGKPATERDAMIEIINLFMEERKGSNLPDDVVTSLITALKKYFKNDDHFMASSAASTLSYIADVKKYIPLVIKSDVLTHLVPLLNNSEEDIIVPAMEVFGNVAKNDSDAGVKAVVEAGVLKHLRKAFALNEDDISAKAVWLLRKLCATTSDDFLNDIFNEGLIYNIVNHLDASHARIDALHAFHDLISFADEKQILEIVDAGAISDLCNFFGFDNYNFTLMTLTCLTEILSKSGNRVTEVAEDIRGCGGYDYISEMNNEDEDDFIREACEHLMEEYFQ